MKNWIEDIFILGDWVLGTSVIKHLNHNRRISKLSEVELQTLQQQKLNKILEFAVKESTYYKQLFKNDQVITIPTIEQFPILTKEKLRENISSIVTKDISNKQFIRYDTSGSSGIPTTVYLDKEEESICRAILLLWWEWTGYYLGKRMLQTGMTVKRGLIKTTKDIVTRTQYMNAFDLTDHAILKQLSSIKKSGYHLGGYASSLYVLAQVAEKHNLNLQFDAAISWGDKMFPHYKKKIETVFRTTVYENYGCNEGLMIGQKVDLPYFYEYIPNVYVELLDDQNKPVLDGEIGRVIVTKLDGFVTPLIRYETGDLAIRLPKEAYPEQRKFAFPLLKMVVGRDTDLIISPEGNRFIVHTFTGIFEFFPEVKQFRIIQNELNSIVIEYIRGGHFSTVVLNRIETQIKSLTKSDIKIIWEEKTHIPNSKSGKPQIIVNNLLSEKKITL